MRDVALIERYNRDRCVLRRKRSPQLSRERQGQLGGGGGWRSWLQEGKMARQRLSDTLGCDGDDGAGWLAELC